LGAGSGTNAVISAGANTDPANWRALRYVGTDPAGHSTDRKIATGAAVRIEASGVGPLTLNGPVEFVGTANNLTTTFGGSGVMNINGGINSTNVTNIWPVAKSGAGTVRISGTANSWNGTTTVAEGTLLVNGTISTSTNAVSVVANTTNRATLGGTGTINRPVSARRAPTS